jgi:hypothetical protein
LFVESKTKFKREKERERECYPWVLGHTQANAMDLEGKRGVRPGFLTSALLDLSQILPSCVDFSVH